MATGTLEKSFAGQKGTVDLDYDGQRVTDPALADQVLAELTGIPNEAFFRSTASVRHHELSDLARDEAALRDRLQASISGADRGTGRAKKKLERALHELDDEGRQEPGPAQGRRGRRRPSAGDGRAGRARPGPARARPRHAVGCARATGGCRTRPRRAPQPCSRRRARPSASTAERTAARERYERFREAVEVATELDELAQTHPSPNPLPVIRQAVERLRVARHADPRAASRAGRRGRCQVRGRAGADVAAAVPLGAARGPRRRADRRRQRSSRDTLGVLDLGHAAAVPRRGRGADRR